MKKTITSIILCFVIVLLSSFSIAFATKSNKQENDIPESEMLTPSQQEHINMLNRMTVMTQQINEAKRDRVFWNLHIPFSKMI